jgi:hypothetical protein
MSEVVVLNKECDDVRFQAGVLKRQAWGKVQTEYVAASYEWRISETLVDQCHAVRESKARRAILTHSLKNV